jgi:hypothetical protein
MQFIDAADTAADCVCCGPQECLCPDDSIQKKIVSAVFAISDIPASYTEEQAYPSTTVSLELNGLDAFNGSYNAIFGEPSGVMSMPNPCEAEDSECPLDDPKQDSCEWKITIPSVVVTGTYALGAFSTSFSGYAYLGFDTSGRPRIGVQARFATAIPFSLQNSLRCGFFPAGVQSFHQEAGFVINYYRSDCTSTDRINFHGPVGPNLDLIINGNQSVWVSGETYGENDTVLVAKFATCNGATGTVFYTNDFSGQQVTPTTVPNGDISVPSCSGVDGGTCDGFDATYTLTVVTT